MRALVGRVRSADADVSVVASRSATSIALQREVAAIVGGRLTADRRAVFDEISAAGARARRPAAHRLSTAARLAAARRCRISTSRGTAAPSRIRSRWLWCDLGQAQLEC